MPEELTGLDFERPILELDSKIMELKNMETGSVNFDQEIKALEQKRDQLMKEIYVSLTPWQRVQLARHPKRPYTLDYIHALFTNFIELHGDRSFGDDPALVGGLAFFGSQSVVVMGHQKGRSVEESMMRNFGMMHPEGYRKALRLMKLAEKFNKPVITFIDTAGAYPGIGAEERGQAEAIAKNLREMAVLKTPVISIIIGEGGSGGALGIGVTDRILMLENAWYSVISPEGCAAILFRDAAKAPDAAKALKLTAQDLLSLKIIDEIIEEPLGGAHRNWEQVMEKLKSAIAQNLKDLQALKISKLLENRYEKYREIGSWTESAKKQLSPVNGKTDKKVRKRT
jgi:acetyl-CoA carboxylase carboxyl transferase subunit alpha